MSHIKIDMNSPEFQEALFSLETIEQKALLTTLKKVRNLTWTQLYADKGLKWEAVISKTSKSGVRVYSFRFSRKYRATALRTADFLCLLGLYPDHDSAYH